MKLSTILGIILITVGVVGLALGGISFTTKTHEASIGPLEATVEEKEEIPIPPIAGGLALLAGITLVVVGRKEG